MKIKGAHALIAALEDLGVTQVFGLPGVQNIEIYDALLDSSIHHVLVRHEQAAVHMADAYARATGKVGVVFSTSGPGATNTVTGIATAYMDSSPVVVITGQVPTSAIGTDAFQEADITTITLPITKHSYLVKEVEELVPSIFEAFYLATSGRPGPVLIDVPGNVALAEVAYAAPQHTPSLPSYKPTIKGNARQVKAAAELIQKAQRPVILAGGGVVSSHANEQLTALAELRTIPVVTTLLAKGVLPHMHTLNYGQAGVYGAPQANNTLQEADVLVAIGTRFSERVTANVHSFAPDAQVIHIDIDPAEIGKNVAVDVPIVGDAATVLESLLKRLDAKGAHKPEVLHQTLAGGETSSYGIDNTTRKVFVLLNEQLVTFADVIITTDVGQHQLWASHLLVVDEPRRFLTSGGLGTMGFGLPAALGAQVAFPESLVVCISGDGSVQMNLQEMATATAQSLPIKLVIINNQSLGLVRQWQELFLEDRISHTMLSKTPDYPLLAQSYGWQGRRIALDGDEQAEAPLPPAAVRELKKELKWLLMSKEPALLEIVVPTSDLLEPMVKPNGSLSEVV